MDKINKILVARENRYKKIVSAFKSGNFFLITFSLNIPGENKTSDLINKVYNSIFDKVNQQISLSFNLFDIEMIRDEAGNISFFTIEANLDPLNIKKTLLNIEKIFGDFSKYIDLDLYIDDSKSISRTEVGDNFRKCFLCNNSAKECSVKQEHDIKTLEEKVLDDFSLFIGGNYV